SAGPRGDRTPRHDDHPQHRPAPQPRPRVLRSVPLAALPQPRMTRTTLLRLLLVVAAVPGVVRALTERAPRFVVPSVRTFGTVGGTRRDLPAAQPPGSLATLGMTRVFRSEFLPAIKTQFVHAATMIELPNGDVAAAWYGGTDEVQP